MFQKSQKAFCYDALSFIQGKTSMNSIEQARRNKRLKSGRAHDGRDWKKKGGQIHASEMDSSRTRCGKVRRKGKMTIILLFLVCGAGSKAAPSAPGRAASGPEAGSGESWLGCLPLGSPLMGWYRGAERHLARKMGPGVQKQDLFQLQLCEPGTQRGVFYHFRGVENPTMAHFKPPAC